MRAVGWCSWLVVLVLGCLLEGCGSAKTGGPLPTGWTTGFWFWGGSYLARSSPPAAAEPLDVLFVQAGTIGITRSEWWDRSELPDPLPQARQYWLVFRYDTGSVSPLSASLPKLASAIQAMRLEAHRRSLPLAGVQLDIDSPTRSLREYAAFLGEVRKHLEPGEQLSITALLDWFRNGTAIGEVLDQVDEFVPQFYDLQTRQGYSREAAVAAPFTAAKWGPIFNRYARRYRIGISTFGRAGGSRDFYGDADPLQFGLHPDFHLEASTTQAKETRLRYTATRDTRVGYGRFDAGDAMEFVLAAPASIRVAVAEARRMGEYCAGVVFFRWPSYNEVLTLQPGEALAAAQRDLPDRAPVLETAAGSCAAVSCTDLYLLEPNPLRAEPTRYRVTASRPLDYFLPKEGMPVRMAGPSLITASFPPYAARGRMYLGRAVSAEPTKFTVEKEK